MKHDPEQIYQVLTREFGEPEADRVEAKVRPAGKERLQQLSPQQIVSTHLAGKKIEGVVNREPGNNSPIGGIKITAGSGWFAARPSGTDDIYKICA